MKTTDLMPAISISFGSSMKPKSSKYLLKLFELLIKSLLND